MQGMAEPRYAAFAGSLLPDNHYLLLGVRLPRLRQLARELAHGDGAPALLRRAPGKRATFEEIMLRGFVAGYAPGLDFAERCTCIDRLVPFLDNWSLLRHLPLCPPPPRGGVGLAVALHPPRGGI